MIMGSVENFLPIGLSAASSFPSKPAYLPPAAENRVSIGMPELERLKPGQHVNTNLVDFYIT
jgi:hypothetical protein